MENKPNVPKQTVEEQLDEFGEWLDEQNKLTRAGVMTLIIMGILLFVLGWAFLSIKFLPWWLSLIELAFVVVFVWMLAVDNE